MATKFHERCLVLQDVAAGLLLNTAVLKKSPPACLTQAEWAKIRKKLDSSFPDVPDMTKTQGFDSIASNAQDVYDQTLPLYQHFVDVCEYTQQANMMINSIPALTAEFKLDKSHPTMVTFMRIITDYLKLHLLMAMIDDRKTILALHLFSFQMTKRTTEPNCARVQATLKKLEKPQYSVAEEMQGISDFVAEVILEFRESITTAFDSDKLRQKNVLNPLDEGLVMAMPTFTAINPRQTSVPLHDELRYADQYAEWTLFAAFICPSILVRPEIYMLFNTLATGMLVLPLYEEIVFDLHHETELLAKTYPPKGFNFVVPKTLKLKKDFKELAIQATTKCGEIRRERRSFLSGEISQLVTLFTDVPGLIAPKFPMVLAALSMARTEVLYYFAHLQVDIPKARAKVYKMEDYFDDQITVLIGASLSLIALVKTHKDVIQNYFSEYLQGAHRLALKDLTDKVKGLAREGVQEIFTGLPNLLAPGLENDFEAFRLDWGRAHAVLLSKESVSVMKNSAVIDLVHRMRLVISHSQYADSVDQLIIDHCDLSAIWHFRTNLLAIFKQCLSATDVSAKYSLSFLNLLSFVADSVHESCPAEQMARGTAASKLGSDMMNEIAARVDVLLKQFNGQMSGLSTQVAPIEAAYRYERLEANPNSNEPFAGFESKAENARSIKALIDVQASAVHFFHSISLSPEEIIVYDLVFRPKELIKKKIQSYLRETYRKQCAGKGGVPPPTKLKATLENTCQALQHVSGYIEFDFGKMLRQVLYEESTSCIENHYIPGSSVANLTNALDLASQCVTQHYTSFYKKICEQAVPGGALQGAVMSPLSKGFIGHGSENFADVKEFKALYHLIGGYGMAVLESELVKIVVNRTERIKEFIMSNTSALNNFKQKHNSPDSWEATVGCMTRDIRGLDSLLVDTVIIGNALCMRRIIADAVRESQAALTPFAGASVGMAKMAIKREAYENNQTLAYLAQESCGLMDAMSGTDVDQSMKTAVQELGVSAQEIAGVWSFLPYAYAASFGTELWKSTQFDQRQDVMTNNLHTSAMGMTQLFKFFNFRHDAVGDFISSASFVLLRMKANSEQFGQYPLRAMCIFVDKFVAETGIVGRGVLQENIPYAILHSSLVDSAALGMK
jgi:NCK-associated protein 1